VYKQTTKKRERVRKKRNSRGRKENGEREEGGKGIPPAYLTQFNPTLAITTTSTK